MLMDSSSFPWRWATFPLAGDVIVPALVVCRNTKEDRSGHTTKFYA